MDFVDEATIRVASGKGGDGMVAFRREKFVPRGGPNGGSGGHGADVVLEASNDLSTLAEFRYQSQYKAPDGGRGGPNNQSGAHQPPLIIPVPVGTAIFDPEKERYVGDLTYHGQTFVAARGGRGGRGNAEFASPTNQAPKTAEFGEPGESVTLRLELRLLADVGVIGFPNAGKSTLIASVSNARPRIADYPFTTLVPNLGVVRVAPNESFVMADVPGLVEGAHEGTGLGHRFLRHIERTRVLLHLVDCSPMTGRDPSEDYRIIRRELERYNPALVKLPEIIGLNKIDIPEGRVRAEGAEDKIRENQDQIIRLISTATGENVQKLIWDCARLVRESPKAPPVVDEQVVRIEGPGQSWSIRRDASGNFLVKGRDPERIVAMADLENDQTLRRVHRQLESLGVLKELRRMDIKHGDTVLVGDFEFDWLDEESEDGQDA